MISAGQPAASSDTTAVASTVAGADGHYRVTVPLRPGTNVIRAASSIGTASGWAQATVKS